MKAILSITLDNAIGKDDELAMTHRDDFKHFQSTTKNAIMICGYGTFHQVKELHNNNGRTLILHSERPRTSDIPDEIEVLTEEEIELLYQTTERDIFIIGGAKTYKTFSDYINEVIITRFKVINPDANVHLDLIETFPRMTRMETIQEHKMFTIYKLEE